MTKSRTKYQRKPTPDKRLREPLYRTDSAPCRVCGQPIAREAQYKIPTFDGVFHARCAATLLDEVDHANSEDDQDAYERNHVGHW